MANTDFGSVVAGYRRYKGQSRFSGLGEVCQVKKIVQFDVMNNRNARHGPPHATNSEPELHEGQ